MLNSTHNTHHLPSGETGYHLPSGETGFLPSRLSRNLTHHLPSGETGLSRTLPSQGVTAAKQTFTDGTVSQLARVLYTVHTNFESQPTEAIREAIKTFGDDPDRNVILQAARCAAEALERKGFILLNSSKAHNTMTVFEQLVSLKQIRIEKLERELDKIYDADSKESSEGASGS